MAVVLQRSSGWVLDSGLLIDRGYQRCIRWKDKKKSHVKCSFKRHCFQIVKSFYNHCAVVEGEYTDVLGKTDKPSKVKHPLPPGNSLKVP